MKLFLKLILALAMASAVAAAADDESPSLLRGWGRRLRRPSGGGSDRRASCNRAEREGRAAVRRVFDKLGGDCANTIGRNRTFQREVQRMADRDYPDNNWRNSRANRCARQAIEREVQAIEKECLHDNTDVCEDLARFAAEQIVDRHQDCVAYSRGYGHASDEPKRNFRRECRQLAQDLCPGETRTVYRDLCGESPNGSLSRTMMDECDSEVRDILRNGEAAFVADYETSA